MMPSGRRRQVSHAVCTGRVEGYIIHIALDGQIDAHLVAPPSPTWVKAFGGFELVRVKGGI